MTGIIIDPNWIKLFRGQRLERNEMGSRLNPKRMKMGGSRQTWKPRGRRADRLYPAFVRLPPGLRRGKQQPLMHRKPLTIPVSTVAGRRYSRNRSRHGCHYSARGLMHRKRLMIDG